MSRQLLYKPTSVFVSNGEVFLCDSGNHRVRKLLRNGQIVSICGTGIRGYNGDDRPATEAQLDGPNSVVVSSSNQVYISEAKRIRKIDQNGIISTIAGTGMGTFNGDGQLAVNANVSHVEGLFVTEEEEILFADCGNRRVRKIDRYGIVSTIAGTGEDGFAGDGQLAVHAKLSYPSSVFMYKKELYIADTRNHRVRKIDRHGIISTIAGNGKQDYNGDNLMATRTSLNPKCVCVHNDQVYMTDKCNDRIRKILSNGMVKIIAGKGVNICYTSHAIDSCLNLPEGMFIDERGQIYFADTDNHCIRKIDQNEIISVIVGMGRKGYAGDVSFDFQRYPHVGPKKRPLIEFTTQLADITIYCFDSNFSHK